MNYNIFIFITIVILNAFTLNAQDCDCAKLKSRNAECTADLGKKDNTIASQARKITQLENQANSNNNSNCTSELLSRDAVIRTMQVTIDNLKREAEILNASIKQGQSIMPSTRVLKDSLGAIIANLRLDLQTKDAERFDIEKHFTETIAQRDNDIKKQKEALVISKTMRDETAVKNAALLAAKDKTIKEILKEQHDRILDSETDVIVFDSVARFVGVDILKIPFKSSSDILDSTLIGEDGTTEWMNKIKRFKRLFWHYERRGYRIKITGVYSISTTKELAKRQAESVKAFLKEIESNFSLSPKDDIFKVITDEADDKVKGIASPTNYVLLSIIK